MLSMAGYKEIKTLFRGNRRIYFTARREKDDLPVIIKTLSPEKSITIEKNRILHEYELLKNSNGAGLPKVYGLESHGDSVALIMESFDGIMLSEYIDALNPDLPAFFNIAISLAATVEKIHQQNIIHKDIQPENIIIDPIRQNTWVVDFRFATLLPKETPVLMNPEILEGNLAYMSPEQTGRMNRALDYRTDFYSLGVLFYKMLIKHLPFTGSDPLELVHGHLARKPVAPHHINPQVPRMVSDIIIKLLAKNAEGRYLSEHGLIEDLKKCRSQFEKTKTIETFPLAIKDLPNKFRIFQKIYGREREIDILLDMFERAGSGDSAYMAVLSGQPGIGKTSLVQEVFKSITEKKGYFISGKFDLFHQNVPYNALVQAFEGLVKQFLTENESRLNYWRERILGALEDNGRIISDVIPEMELLIGKQPPVKNLDLVETQNQFNRVFMDFIRVIAAPEHPLVIFLDDVQWADAATIKLIEELMTDVRIGHLLLIAAYRDNEVDEHHPVFRMLINFELEQCHLAKIALTPLKLEDSVQLIADSIYCGKQAAEPLAEIVNRKTGGNPFFINQFLILLYQRDLLFFNPDQGSWKWNLTAIKAIDITANVVDLLLQRLKLMPEETRHVMMMAACIGSSFNIDILGMITRKTPSQVIFHLLPAVDEDLVIIASYQNFREKSVEYTRSTAEKFRFRHDRVRQASYRLIAEENRKQIHLKIGDTLLGSLDALNLEENIFDVIYHFNMASDLITQVKKREQIAKLNLFAGNKAKSMAAFEPALNYFSNGLMLLDPKSWRRRYDLTLKLHEECAESAYLCGQYDRVKIFFNTVVKNARNELDRVNVYLSRIHALISEHRRFEALGIAQKILKEIGVNLPANPTRADALRTLKGTIETLAPENIDGLINMPDMKDRRHLAAMKVMGQVISPSYQVSPDWFLILTCQQMNLSIRHGHAPSSALAYALLGLILSGHVGDIDTGYKLGKLGLALQKRFDAKELKAKLHLGVYAMNHHWKFHLRDTLEYLMAGYNAGIETGDFEYAGYNAACYCYHAFFAGKPLDEIESEMARFDEACRKIKQDLAVAYIAIYHQVVLNLLEDDNSTARISGQAYDEEDLVEQHPAKSGDITAMFSMHVCKIMLCYMFGDYPEAIKYADSADQMVERVPGLFITVIYRFYDSLSRLAAFDRLSAPEQQSTLQRVGTNQLLMKTWMSHAPENYAHKFHLVEAEHAKVCGNDPDAIKNYDLAIKFARENHYINEEALANEVTAIYWMGKNQMEFAALLMQKACRGYRTWGASRKAKQLMAAYPRFFEAPASGRGKTITSRKDGHAYLEWQRGGLDLSTLLKSSQAISGEIVLGKLLCTMMKILIENTGAEHGFLILKAREELRLAARGVSGLNDVEVRSFDAEIKDSDQLSPAVVQYVARTHEFVVLKNAGEEDRFRNDLYIRVNRSQSILCFPIIYKSKLTGIIYLENRLSPDVFSPERIEVLKLLTSQIAVSIENTHLFEEQKRAEAKYRGIFENALEGIFLSTPDGRFVSANPALALLMGYDSPEDLCASITDIDRQIYISREDRTTFMRTLLKTGTVKDFEVRVRKKNGESVWVSLNARSIYDENGDLAIIEGFVIDISQRKAATEALIAREENLRRENVLLRSNIKDRYRFGRIIGKSQLMQEVYELILKAAGTDAPVIIYGESGTGKELVAQAIYEMSERKSGKFVPVNCGAIPDNLLESEFFGYKRGAFTGANTDRNGFLDLARDGVLFLDELGEIPIHFQVKLLRALENGSYTPLGSNVVQTSNARVIAATSRDLQEAILTGSMRKDFYYRIHILPIYLPLLRERREDIPLLIEHFINTHQKGGASHPVKGKMIETMLSYDWPGNVRELQNVLHRYCTLGSIDFAPIAGAPKVVQNTIEPKVTESDHHSVMGNIAKNHILQALEIHQWNRKKTADYLGIPLRSFYRKLKLYNIN